MIRTLISILLMVCLTGCITSNTKVKVTDPKTGNSVTISDQGLALDIQQIEKDGYKVEVIQNDKE